MDAVCSQEGMNKLVKNLVHDGLLRTDNVIKAFSKIQRSDFIPSDLLAWGEADASLPIGFGQTISQPLTVAFMLELLQVKSGDNVLDVGSGSGWTSALLAHMVGEKGRISSLEIVRELFEFGKKNIDKYSFVRNGTVELYCQSASRGFEKNSPYDCILVSASAMEAPEALKKQLKIGGKMVIPIRSEIWFIKKEAESDFAVEKFPGFAFVPFVK